VSALLAPKTRELLFVAAGLDTLFEPLFVAVDFLFDVFEPLFVDVDFLFDAFFVAAVLELFFELPLCFELALFVAARLEAAAGARARAREPVVRTTGGICESVALTQVHRIYWHTRGMAGVVRPFLPGPASPLLYYCPEHAWSMHVAGA
jgi:hypothetical protein